MKKRSVINIISSSVIFISALIFFCLIYPAHIRFQEQYQLFEFTGDYFASVTLVPGGFADWCGRFLTQFFIVPWAGGILIAGLMLLLLLLCRKLNSGEGASRLIFEIIPTVFLFSMFLSDETLTGAAVAVILPLTASVLFRKVGRGPLRTISLLLTVPILYFLCGPAAILFPLLLPSDEPTPVKAAAPVLFLLCPAVFQFFVHFPLQQLITGVHYVRIPSSFPAGLWLTVLSVSVALYIPEFTRGKKILSLVISLVFLLIGTALITYHIDMEKEQSMRYDSMVRDGNWDAIISAAKKTMPDNAFTVGCLNLALAQKGLLPECQFSFFQSGEKGLFPSYSISYRSLPGISEIYWHLGMVNACQQYIFDAQEAIPDFQKSGRCYKRLAETNLINGDYTVAAKYINALKHTLFYRRWAGETEKFIAAPESIGTQTLYGKLRSFRADDPVSLFNENNKYAMCKELFMRNPDNRMAEQYLYSLLLLEKDLDGFSRLFRADTFTAVPKHYQEALLLICLNEKRPMSSVAGTVSDKNIQRMKSFISDMRSNIPDAAMKKRYGDTYWYYSIFE